MCCHARQQLWRAEHWLYVLSSVVHVSKPIKAPYGHTSYQWGFGRQVASYHPRQVKPQDEEQRGALASQWDLPVFPSLSLCNATIHLIQTFAHTSFLIPFVSQTHMPRWALAVTERPGEGKKKAVAKKSPLPCYYTHQTSLIRQQQNFINRMDIIEWACYKWALSGPYSATKWVFSVQCSHLRHHA